MSRTHAVGCLSFFSSLLLYHHVGPGSRRWIMSNWSYFLLSTFLFLCIFPFPLPLLHSSARWPSCPPPRSAFDRLYRCMCAWNMDHGLVVYIRACIGGVGTVDSLLGQSVSTHVAGCYINMWTGRWVWLGI
ncbi:hypothetical protein IWX90DRAFT_138154 [Phyllosticta citrichinensis]|uniref:Uncharacterized protein n=1 Tax=Phyllosticta citrichinensis TaxID=1130410 RepID=A0ABR1XY92_9PEZI